MPVRLRFWEICVFRLNSLRSTATLVLAVAMGLGLAACGNDDETDGKTVANTPTGDQTKLPEPPKLVAAGETVKERGNDVLDWLKMTPEKADKKAANEPPKPEQKSEVAKALAPTPLPPPRETQATPAPVQVASSAPVERPTLQPVSASARETRDLSTPAPAPVVASAAPVTPVAVPAPAAALRLISREQPGFPVEAVRKGVTSGHVRARISVAIDGSVSKVEVIQSSPPRVFDSAVTAAVSRWKYAPMSEPTSTVTEFDFKESD
jgi:protein TonB